MDNNILNLVAAIILSIIIIFGWQYFYEKPRAQKFSEETKAYQEQIKKQKELSAIKAREVKEQDNKKVSDNIPSVRIKSSVISGSISTKGLRFDDISLLQYNAEIDDDSPLVKILDSSDSSKSYFVEIGWLSNNQKEGLPNNETVWQADKEELSSNSPVNFYWTNKDGVKFVVTLSIDDDYLFNIKQSIINNSKNPINLQSYALINRIYEEPEGKIVNILHQGFIGAVNNELKEFTYDKIKDKKKANFAKSNVNWLGITDKYWLAAFIPDQNQLYSSNYSYAIKGGHDRYQADLISNSFLVEPNGDFTLSNQLFVGPKKVNLLDKYEKNYQIKLFDRAIDFGWLYVLTKPMFYSMNFFYKYVGNFGISIMIVTVIVKLLLFGIANKSYRTMKKMKKLQPEMERLKELYENDKARLNQEVMALYKKEKVNPVTGCLPMFIQIPVFFAIYKVLYVTIEMRHAPFYGWVQDLSAPDPTTLFNLFGILNYDPPSFLMIGAWPLIMALTMFLQQKMSPAPTDPVQAQVMKFMPLIFLFMFSSFPAGLLIYWSWNNILSIIQQYYINKSNA